jgi:hypothetical protein
MTTPDQFLTLAAAVLVKLGERSISITTEDLDGLTNYELSAVVNNSGALVLNVRDAADPAQAKLFDEMISEEG